VYSIQSILGPRDIFPGYSIPTLKPNAGRLLIQSMEDYGIISPESEARASRKRPRNILENEAQVNTDHSTQGDSEPGSGSSKTTSGSLKGKKLAAHSNPEDFQNFNPPLGTEPNLTVLETEGPFHGSRASFERWGIHFEGTENESHEHSDCGVCGTSLVDSATFQCQTCSLIIHQTCLQYTTLKDQIRDSKSTQWACPICSLCSFCSKHPVNGIENLEPTYFTCIFCPVKEPLIMMERMKSGLFSHSLCRFIANVEETQLKKCSICGVESSGLV
jgi:hypothetical protein